MAIEFIGKPQRNKRTGQISFNIPQKKLTSKEKKKLLSKAISKDDLKIIIDLMK